MDPITVDQLRTAIREKNILEFPYGKCSICHVSTLYLFSPTGQIYLDTRCNCSRDDQVHMRSYDQLAELFNRQTPENRAELWAQFLNSGSQITIRQPISALDLASTAFFESLSSSVGGMNIDCLYKFIQGYTASQMAVSISNALLCQLLNAQSLSVKDIMSIARQLLDRGIGDIVAFSVGLNGELIVNTRGSYIVRLG